MQSIQSKLSAGLLLSLVITFTALWILVSFNIQFLAKEYIASRLKHDAELLLSAVDFNDNGVISIDTARTGLIYKQPFSGHYYVIRTNNQSISSRSLWDYNLKAITVKTGQKSSTFQAGPDEQSLLLMTGSYIKQGNKLAITIAEDLNPFNNKIKQFKYWFAAMAFGMLLILVILQVIILRNSLRPLTRIHAELKLLQQGRLNKLNTESPGELRPLIDEVNHLLSIMEQRLRRSRDALSDLAHTIKKPLTVIKQITDQNTITDTNRIMLIKQADNIFQLSDHILKRARLAGHRHTGSLFSFSDDLPALIKTLDMIYTDKAIKISTNVPHNIICPIDREDMLELLGNLLDNAYKWATANVALTVFIDHELHIRIEDDGQGVNPEEISELSKRGVRLDERVQGHGFGLAITADIVNDYNGNISFSHSVDLGGLKTDITLPL